MLLRTCFLLPTCALLFTACATASSGAEDNRAPREIMRTPTPSRASIEFIGYDQAVALASGYALGSGDLLRIVRAEREGDTWNVDVDVRALMTPKRTQVVVDASTGELIELRSVPMESTGD